MQGILRILYLIKPIKRISEIKELIIKIKESVIKRINNYKDRTEYTKINLFQNFNYKLATNFSYLLTF